MKLYIKQKVFSWRDRFYIKDEFERDRFYVEGELFSLGKRLHIYDEYQQEVAVIHEKVWSWMPQYTVFVDGHEVCKIVKKFSWLTPRYEVQGPAWRVEGNFMEHDYWLYDGEQPLMQLTKHWFTWGDSYEMDIVGEDHMLPCLCIMLAIDADMASAAGAAATT